MAGLEAKQDQIRASADAELQQEIRNVEFHRPLGNVQAIGNFLVDQVLEQPIEHFLFASAQLAGTISSETTPLRCAQNRIHEKGKHLARNPKAAVGNQQQRTRELPMSLLAIQDALYTLPQQRVALRLFQLFPTTSSFAVGK